ncbi:P-loop containing nucleoside triphosphate hydrolase protein [Mycena capillaripes]|nr:P-loop containing nucleoside triphosphate hydrolase protein [Mycena capillaripes]
MARNLSLSHNTIKCMLVGDGAVGKFRSLQPCLLTSYTYKEFPTGYVPSVFGGHAETVMFVDVPYTLGLFDTAGEADYDRLRPLSYPRTDVFLVCFCVGMPASFSNVKEKWFPEAHHHCPGVPCVVAATQIDLRVRNGDNDGSSEKRPFTFTTKDGQRLAKEVKAAGYVECSAKTQEGVKEAFDAAVAAAVKHQYPVIKRKRKCIVV